MGTNSINIIGAGFAGLSTGIYSQMNGCSTQIFEMHDLPGGLCTSWERKGYTIDCCIHWLVGSNPKSSFHRLWDEVGISQGQNIVNAEEFTRYETKDGRKIALYCNVDKLEKHLLEFSPEDADKINEFISCIRVCTDMNLQLTQAKATSKEYVKMNHEQKMAKWGQTSIGEFVAGIKNPDLLEAIAGEDWTRSMSFLGRCMTFAWVNCQDAGYPIGGSLPMSRALEKRYQDLGGIIHYKKRVERILVKNDSAIGVRLVDGTEHYSERVISAADGYTTIFKMLEGKYADDATRLPYEKWTPFPALLFVGIGVNRTFTEEPTTVQGFSFPLYSPVEIADSQVDRLPVILYNQDPTLAPEGKTSLVVMIPSDIEYWRKFKKNRQVYIKKKKQVGEMIVKLLGQRFTGIENQVEMIDVATPLTWERYTGNWQGSFEGWIPTTENSNIVLSKTLPGLQNFYMVGQWLKPGGGLPTCVMQGRELVQTLCQIDNKEFVTTVP